MTELYRPPISSICLRLIAALVASLLAACGTTAGDPEYRIYAQAVGGIAEAAQPVLDRLRVAEREMNATLIDGGGSADDLANGGPEVLGARAGIPRAGIAPKFRVEHATIFAASGDPPLTAAIRLSLASLKRFNDVVLVYADGRALDQARTDVEALTGNISGAFAVLGVAAPGLSPAVGLLAEGAGFAGQFGSRDAFRTILLSEGERLDELLAALTLATEDMFLTLTAADFAALDAALFDSERTKELTRVIRGERALIAEFVLLIGTARLALADTRAAIETPRTLGSGIADAVALTADIRARLERIREIAATIR